MEHTFFFENINIVPPREQILRRLGYKKGKTHISPAQIKDIDLSIENALIEIQLQGAASRIPILRKMESETVLSSGQTFTSAQIAVLLARSDAILLIGATAGPKIVEKIAQDSARNQLTQAVVLDAVASEMTDAALDWIIRYCNHEFSRENKRLTKSRFSAGYGDFPLENQKWIYDALMLHRLGIRLSENFMLIPEKSVTALLGVEKVVV